MAPPMPSSYWNVQLQRPPTMASWFANMSCIHLVLGWTTGQRRLDTPKIVYMQWQKKYLHVTFTASIMTTMATSLFFVQPKICCHHFVHYLENLLHTHQWLIRGNVEFAMFHSSLLSSQGFYSIMGHTWPTYGPLSRISKENQNIHLMMEKRCLLFRPLVVFDLTHMAKSYFN